MAGGMVGLLTRLLAEVVVSKLGSSSSASSVRSGCRLRMRDPQPGPGPLAVEADHR